MFWQGIAPFVRGAAGIDEFVTELNGWAREQAADILADDEPAELVENVFEGFSTEFVSEVSPKSMRVVIGPLAGTVIEWVVPDADATIVEAAARAARPKSAPE